MCEADAVVGKGFTNALHACMETRVDKWTTTATEYALNVHSTADLAQQPDL